MTKTIFLICGKAEYGKTTFANILKEKAEKRGLRVVRTAFAAALKWAAREYFGWDGAKDEAGRHLLQHFGTEEVRRFFPLHWLNSVAEVLCPTTDRWDVAIIDDWRFVDEYEEFAELCKNFNINVVPVKIIRIYDNGNLWNNSLTPEARLHASEIALDNYYVANEIINLDLGGLSRQAEKLLDKELK